MSLWTALSDSQPVAVTSFWLMPLSKYALMTGDGHRAYTAHTASQASQTRPGLPACQASPALTVIFPGYWLRICRICSCRVIKANGTAEMPSSNQWHRVREGGREISPRDWIARAITVRKLDTALWWAMVTNSQDGKLNFHTKLTLHCAVSMCSLIVTKIEGSIKVYILILYDVKYCFNI